MNAVSTINLLKCQSAAVMVGSRCGLHNVTDHLQIEIFYVNFLRRLRLCFWMAAGHPPGLDSRLSKMANELDAWHTGHVLSMMLGRNVEGKLSLQGEGRVFFRVVIIGSCVICIDLQFSSVAFWGTTQCELPCRWRADRWPVFRCRDSEMMAIIRLSFDPVTAMYIEA